MISVGSEARSAGVSKKIASAAAAVIVGLAGLTFSAAAEPPLSNSEAAPQIAQARATCRTPEVEARIQELTKEIAAREPQDEGARKVITSLVINGNPISTNSDLYRRYYNHLQSSQQLRQELAALEGLPPCPQPVAATPPVYTPPTVYGPGAYTPPAVYGTGAYTPPVYPGYQPSYNSPVTPQSPGYNSFYYTPGMSSPPPYNPGLYNGPGLYNAPGVYNAPGLYNAPIAPPPPVTTGYSLFNAPVYNAPWEVGGFYFGATGSASFLQDSDLIKRIEPRTTDSVWSTPRSMTGTSTNWINGSGLSEGGSKTKVLSSSTGYNAGARAGYQFGNFRFEGEFDYANNSADTLENPRREISTDLFRREDSLRGSTTGMTFLGNVIYDFNVPGFSGYGVTPHILAGIGAGRISTDLKWGDRTIINSSDWNFAYQLGAGLRYQVMPNWSVDLDYRYRGIADITLHNEFEKITVPYRSHNFVASLTYSFTTWSPFGPPPIQYTPPPPPPPPARPALPTM